MTTQHIAYTLNTIALLLQLGGALLVVLDLRDGQRNTATFKRRLDTAQEKRQEHLAALDTPFAVIPGNWMSGHKRRELKFPEESRESIVNQVGPAATEERNALIAYVNAQNDRKGWQVWVGVTLVVLGALIAYAAAMITT